MQVALHVSKLHQIASASNRVCDIGRIGGEVYSQEALCKVDVNGCQHSSSTPEVVGKTIKLMSGKPVGREAGAPITPNERNILNFARFGWRCLVTYILVMLVVISGEINMRAELMRIIRISVAASVSVRQASMQVALHVSKLHNIASASNRVCDIGRIGGEVYSQEALCKVDVERFSSSWFGGCRRQLSA